ncbi:hypothetical protein WICPIJ_001165 [Wickerhamomyces pijperi]|uniref:N-acetyltransferase ECO1 n=1 Tax=Wickerhamomyces pijperi TaxID=599730 RepID=A0A9P8QBA5_WICPI|nr:hypothetical protein WICPIJ_001165 [Wickerhamomyces pijperi]
MRVQKPQSNSRRSRSIKDALNTSQSELTSPPPSSSPQSTPPSSQHTEQSLTVKPKILKQSLLNIGLHDKKTCTECGMSYLKNVQSDIKLHEKYHQRLVNGIGLSNTSTFTKIEQFTPTEFIVKVNAKKAAEVSKTLELLQIVNQSLNAPDDNDFWMNQTGENGSAFLYIKDKTAVAIVTITKETQGKWYSIEDGRIVSDKEIPILCGISRIFCASSQRRQGISIKLLDSVRRHMIYGVVVPKSKLAWSQPSFSGGKLASVYNGVKHKSGRILVPVYKETRLE